MHDNYASILLLICIRSFKIGTQILNSSAVKGTVSSRDLYSVVPDSNPFGPFIHSLRCVLIWFRIRSDICMLSSYLQALLLSRWLHERKRTIDIQVFSTAVSPGPLTFSCSVPNFCILKPLLYSVHVINRFVLGMDIVFYIYLYVYLSKQPTLPFLFPGF